MALVVLVVSIVRKVDQSEWDCSVTKKKEKHPLKMGPLGDFKKFPKKILMRFLDSGTVRKM